MSTLFLTWKDVMELYSQILKLDHDKEIMASFQKELLKANLEECKRLLNPLIESSNEKF